MKSEKNIDYFMNAHYDVILRKKNNDFCLLIPELSLFVVDKDLTEAYKKLQAEKESYFKKMIEYEALDIVKPPMSVLPRKRFTGDLSLFFLKTLVIAVILTLMSAIIVEFTLNSVENWAKVSLQYALQQNHKLNILTNDEREQFKLLLRKKVQQIKPFFEEVQVLWKDDSNPVPQTSD